MIIKIHESELKALLNKSFPDIKVEQYWIDFDETTQRKKMTIQL